MSLSTSNSSPLSRIPMGAVWAIFFFALVEFGVRMLAPKFALQVEQHNYVERDTADYDAVSLAIELMAAPEVLIMGTSRAREALQSPDLLSILEPEIGREVEVRNYGVAGARIDTSLVIFERLVAEGKLPKVIVLAVDGSDFRDATPSHDRLRLSSLGSISSDIARNGWASETEFSYAIGNSIPLRLVASRRAVHRWLVERRAFSLGEARSENSAFGGTSGWARAYSETLAKKGRPPRMRSKGKRVRRTRNSYVIYDYQLAKLGLLVDLAHSHDIRVVLIELPVAPKVRISETVGAVRERLRAALRAQAAKPCTWVATIDAHDSEFGVREFRDDSHNSARGAKLYANLVSPVIADAVRSVDSNEDCLHPATP